MIRYQLNCAKGHAFEGWFRNADAFERQARRKLVVCPQCGSVSVSKAIMAPNVVRSVARTGAAPVAADPKPPPAPQSVASASQSELRAMMRKLRDEIVARSDYVGPRFAEDARKIHHEESEPRGIYGEASPAEVKELAEEGVEVYPLPVIPEDHN